MKWIRNILKGISLTAAMFVFQACYGPMEDYQEGPLIGVTFHVVDATDGHPIPNIKVESRWQDSPNDSFNSVTSWYENGYTDSTGLLSFETHEWGHMYLKFHFTDSDAVYTYKDTILSSLNYDTVDILLDRIN